MALNSSGPISLIGNIAGQSIQLEIGGSGQLGLLDSSVRNLFGVASGPVDMFSGYGKSSAFAYTISSNQQEINLRTLALAAGWNGSLPATITVDSGVYIWSDNTSNPALTIDGSWPNGLTFINNGYIMGRGGDGATGVGINGNAGGPAISLGLNVNITNNSYIGGGGGGGASQAAAGGGGAGGGTGGSFSSVAGGSGGTVGNTGNSTTSGNVAPGAGGGRIFPGTGGAGSVVGLPLATGGGAGGGAGAIRTGAGTGQNIFFIGRAGGGGGGWGASGGPNAQSSRGPGTEPGFCIGGAGGANGSAGGAGSFGAGTTASTASGGSGGKAINLNGYSTTVSGSGTVYGAIS